MSCSNMSSSGAFITPEYLSNMHKIDIAQAEIYYRFCIIHTIRYKECYGNGSIMWALWQKELNKASIAVNELIKSI